MFHRSISIALTIALLACPLVCRTGLALPRVFGDQKLATGTCCPHCRAQSQGQAKPGPSEPSPAPADRVPVKCDCICAGAVVGDGGQALQVDLPLSLDLPPVATIEVAEQITLAAHEFSAPHELPVPSGRMLRALISSLLC